MFIEFWKISLRFTFSKRVLLPTLLRNFLMRHFHGAELRGADGSGGPYSLRTWHPWIFISGAMWSKSSTVFVFTTFNTWNSESGKLAHLSLLMFLDELVRYHRSDCLKAWGPSFSFYRRSLSASSPRRRNVASCHEINQPDLKYPIWPPKGISYRRVI